MTIKVLLFGITADIVGEKTIEFKIINSCSVRDFKQLFIDKFPKLSNQNNFSIAVNMEYATDTVMLKNNDVVALIPPVSGG
jgi:molybdopterin converting factor small subunit